MSNTQAKVGKLPECDIHKYERGEIVPAKYDGKTINGPWAYMCQACFDSFGVGLGLGRGQELILEES